MTAVVPPPSGQCQWFSVNAMRETAQLITANWNQPPLIKMATISGHASVQTISVEIRVKLTREGVVHSAHVWGLCASTTLAKHRAIRVANAFLDTGGTGTKYAQVCGDRHTGSAVWHVVLSEDGNAIACSCI